MKIFISLAVLILLSGFIAVAQETAIELNYKFPDLENLVYQVDINGTAGWSSFDEKPMNFKVKASFIIEMLNLGVVDGLYQIKMTARKSKILVNDEVFEDTTGSETALSTFIPQLLLQIDKKGKIHKTTTLKTGMLDFVPFLSMFPIFPDSLTPGKRWIQKIESFNFPSGKIPQLEFAYIYEGRSKNQEKIRMVSNQVIKHTSKEKGTEVKITGRNSSDGEILFDSNRGAMTKANGKLSLDVNYMFQVPDPDRKGKFLPMPMRIMLNLNFSFSLTG
ncbi:MAG: hypothetical protein NC906_06640 [Candidatus Omnitrophica bacterium]|nr:hypothetical protein [Candidatus Omnitrophota bacterium]MCM8816539.1 hypothetical protein [Candidatus Omnitrophota bacterium]